MRIDLADGACLSVDDAVAMIEGGCDVVICSVETARGVLRAFGCDEPYIDDQIAFALS